MEFIRVNKLFRVIASDIFAARGKVSWIDERIGEWNLFFFSYFYTSNNRGKETVLH